MSEYPDAGDYTPKEMDEFIRLAELMENSFFDKDITDDVFDDFNDFLD